MTRLHEAFRDRVWQEAYPAASDSEKWQMQLWITKSRESRDAETTLKMIARFHQVAASVLERRGIGAPSSGFQ